MTYGRSISKALAHFNIPIDTWPRLAADRAAWRNAINGGLLNTTGRPKRAAAAKTNRLIVDSLANERAGAGDAGLVAAAVTALKRHGRIEHTRAQTRAALSDVTNLIATDAALPPRGARARV